MSSRLQITEQVKKNLRSVLLSKAGGVDLNRIVTDYVHYVGEPLLYQHYGFRNMESFLQAVPDVAKYVFVDGADSYCNYPGLNEQ